MPKIRDKSRPNATHLVIVRWLILTYLCLNVRRGGCGWSHEFSRSTSRSLLLRFLSFLLVQSSRGDPRRVFNHCGRAFLDSFRLCGRAFLGLFRLGGLAFSCRLCALHLCGRVYNFFNRRGFLF